MRKDILRIIKILRKHQLIQIAVAIVVVINITALIAFYFEHQKNYDQFSSFGDALWWSLVTSATVGYGDIVPKTFGGRIIGSVTIVSGLILISLFTAVISSVFVARKIKESQGLQDINFTDHILICGWNFHVEEILKIFDRYNKHIKIVLVNEAAPEKMETIIGTFANIDLQFVRGDYSRENILHRANVQKAQSAIIVPDSTSPTGALSDEKTLLALLTMKSINTSLKVYTHVLNRENIQHLKRANADEVIVSDQHIGFFLANHILYPGATQVAMEMIDYENGNDIHRIPVPEEFVGKQFGDYFLHLKKTKNWTLLGIVTEEETVSLSDILSHDTSGIDAFIERKFKEAGINVSERMGMRVNVNPPFDYELQKKDWAVILGTFENK